MAQKDTIFGGLRGSAGPIPATDPMWKDILVLLLLIGGALLTLWAVGAWK